MRNELNTKIITLEKELKASQETTDQYLKKFKEISGELENERKERIELKQRCELLTVQLEESHNNYELLQEENAKVTQPKVLQDTLLNIEPNEENKHRNYNGALNENKRLKSKLKQLTEHEINLIAQNNELNRAMQSYKNLYENERKLCKDLRLKISLLEEDIKGFSSHTAKRNQRQEECLSEAKIKLAQLKDVSISH